MEQNKAGNLPTSALNKIFKALEDLQNQNVLIKNDFDLLKNKWNSNGHFQITAGQTCHAYGKQTLNNPTMLNPQQIEKSSQMPSHNFENPSNAPPQSNVSHQFFGDHSKNYHQDLQHYQH